MSSRIIQLAILAVSAISVSRLASASTPTKPAESAALDVQFFGDTYLPAHVLMQTTTTAADPRLFEGVSEVLQSATFNIVNFEGAATAALVPHEFKKYLLRMPLEAAEILRSANISVATLANNHAFDFGYQGLFDTMTALRAAGIETIGAGKNLDEASRPLILPSRRGAICIYAYTRTLPSSFWAKTSRPGTAYLSVESMTKQVRDCSDAGYYTIVTFHWGEELSKSAQPYQSYLARQLIDAGADAVIGHHPHVLQPIEIYAGKPIIHSLGNFAFGTSPAASKQEGMAVAFQLGGSPADARVYLTPLNVKNSRVAYRPRLLDDNDVDPIASLLPDNHGCVWEKAKRRWACHFKKPES